MRTLRSAALVATASMLAFSSASSAQTGVSNAGTGGQAPVAIPNEPPSEPPRAGEENPVTAAVDDSVAPAESGVQDIIVTATRRSANLQTVPLAVTAIQANELSAQGLKTVADLPRMVPGLSTTRGSASTNIYLRGVGTSSSGFNTETPIATYLDGYYLPNTASTLFSFNNIERVEVLKGPQGTLYGRNATGGLINVITREPGRDTRVDASIGYGNYDTLSLNFYGSTPVSDTVSTGVAFTHTKQSDGWGRNVFTGNDNMKFRETGVQGKVRWEPSDATRVTLEGMYVDISSDQGLVDGIAPGSRGTDGTPFLEIGRASCRERVLRRV